MPRLFAVLMLVAMACSGSSSIALSDFDQEMQQARCERLVRCKLLPDLASCLAFTRPPSDPSVAAAVAAHKITYDGGLARQCVDATAAQSCDATALDVHLPPAACGTMLTGHVADGDTCMIDAECGSGTCSFPMDCPDSGCCTGRCRATQAPAAPGTACDKARDCQAGLVCGMDLTCHAPAGEGGACRSDRECRDGLACVEASDVPGSCHPLPHAGERCPFQRCASENLRCDAATNTCIAVGLPGAACMTALDCSIYTECDATSHLCREFPRLGMPCDGTCIDGSFCMLDGGSGLTGTCVALLPNNAVCFGDQSCVSGNCPDGPVFRSCVDLPACF